MKTAIYIEEGITQIVLSPEDEFEQEILGRLMGEDIGVEVTGGSFYQCAGGWTRQKEVHWNRSTYSLADEGKDRSLILRVEEKDVT